MLPGPLHRRPLDLILVAFFAVNLGFITDVVDFEQLVIGRATRSMYQR